VRYKRVTTRQINNAATTKAPSYPPDKLPRFKELLPWKAFSFTDHLTNTIKQRRPYEAPKIVAG